MTVHNSLKYVGTFWPYAAIGALVAARGDLWLAALGTATTAAIAYVFARIALEDE